MNRLSSKLVELKNTNQKALVAYLVAGDPDLDTTLELMHLFVKSGVDVIEIGVPFTDPIAEGPTIQRAHDRALKNDISLKMILDTVKKFRTVDKETPIVLMGYLNTFISHIDMVKSADSNSVDSILVVDVPGELNLETYGISNPNINTISLISPTTKEERVESIAKNSTGFIYYVNLRGVTGSSNLNIDEIQKNIARIQQYTDLPTMAGFGIKSIEDAKTLAAYSDGIVIGSSIVEMIDEESLTKEFGRIGKYLREMKTAIS
ncbi:tryptophan synthase subunit alpha [Gammaproteobacteria bacterium]|nr:tryptophan synthase subunit alpha [Gammaproteobacteria bacterium]